MPCGFGKILPIFKATDLVFWGLNEFSKVAKRKIKKKSYTKIYLKNLRLFFQNDPKSQYRALSAILLVTLKVFKERRSHIAIFVNRYL